jgi:hypothetical protein
VATASLANGGIHRFCMKGTRLAVLDEARQWIVDDGAPQIFWLNGVAGSGKSTVAKQLAEEWKTKGCLAGRFFFSRDAEETRSPKLFFSTIAQQGLSHLGPTAQTVVALGIRKLRDPVSATLEEQCSMIFDAPLQIIEKNTVLVLDALDECESKTCQQLLHILLPRLPNLPRLKIFLTSRPELHIRGRLEDHAHKILSFRIDAPENQQDIELYIRHNIQALSISEDQVRQLVERAGGLFIWAKTVCELLQNIREDRNRFIRRVLSEGIRQMDSIYRITLEQAIRSNQVEESVEAYMNVLKVIVMAYEPLAPSTINRLLGVADCMEIVNDLRSVLESHGADDPVRFLHPTFREFLLDSRFCGQFYVDRSLGHHLMGVGCLRTMKDDLKGYIYDAFECHHKGQLIKNLDQIRVEGIPPALQYSCFFWVNHVSTANIAFSQNSGLISAIEEFFTINLIHWLFVITLVGTFNAGTNAIRKLLSLEIVSVRDSIPLSTNFRQERKCYEVVFGRVTILTRSLVSSPEKPFGCLLPRWPYTLFEYFPSNIRTFVFLSILRYTYWS